MRFDWYQATIHQKTPVVLEACKKLGHEIRPNDSAARAWRYKQGWEVHHNTKGVVARVFWGNGEHPHAIATSDATDEFVDLVRNEWPDSHLVTRMDAAQDFNDAQAYPRLQRVARKVAKKHRLAFPAYVDKLNVKAGRTQYIGSDSSPYRARLYEKGLEQLGKIQASLGRQGLVTKPEQFPTIRNDATGEYIRPQDWIRLEMQARPKGEEARRLAAKATPEQAWAFTDWTHHLAREALALDLERYYIRTRKMSKDEETARWMCRQYGGMLLRLHSDLGDWACVGLQIGEIIKEIERCK